jgi:hypothetical protein
MSDLKSHPLAEIFPRLDGADLKALADDIRKNGLRQAIVTYKGELLDGRNRLAACKIAGVEPRFKEFAGDDPLGYVISLNLTRRHMNASQRATVAAKIANMRQGARTDLQPSANWPEVSQTKAAKMLNVGERSVRRARKVIEKADPKLVTDVEQGKVSVTAAAKTFQSESARSASRTADKYMPPEVPTLRGAAEMRAAKGNTSGAVMDVLKFTETPPSADGVRELKGAIASIGGVENRIRKIATPEIMAALAVTREAIANYIKRAA